MASPWSCVTYMNVMPTWSWIVSSSRSMCWRSFRSSAASGSSRRSTCGRSTSARAMATRCFWPPESWLGYFQAWSAMLSQIVIVGNSA